MNNKVLLISVDNLRYDCVSYIKNRPHLKQFYVENLVDTPTLDEIAENSTVFTDCFSTSSYTTAGACLFIYRIVTAQARFKAFFFIKK
jgi:hypothetical protein